MKKYIVSCRVKQSIAIWSTLYLFPVIEAGVSRELVCLSLPIAVPSISSYCAYELGVPSFLKSDLIVGEVMEKI